ncbi:unnamed protein product [Lampetra fluviatilis]
MRVRQDDERLAGSCARPAVIHFAACPRCRPPGAARSSPREALPRLTATGLMPVPGSHGHVALRPAWSLPMWAPRHERGCRTAVKTAPNPYPSQPTTPPPPPLCRDDPGGDAARYAAQGFKHPQFCDEPNPAAREFLRDQPMPVAF